MASKRDLHLAMGLADPGSDGDGSDDESTEPEDSGDGEAQEDEAIDLALDTSQDDATRREAFRRAVKLCTQAGY